MDRIKVFIRVLRMEIPIIPSSASPELTMLVQAMRKGDRRLACEISLKLTVSEPTNELAWLYLAWNSESLQETINALNRVLELNPGNKPARRMLFQAMGQLLRQDPFLTYQSETHSLYKIRTPAGFVFTLPKDRAIPEQYPPLESQPTRAMFHWLGWSLVGLLPAGLGTLICAPAATLNAVRLLSHQSSQADRRRAWVVIWCAAILWLLGLGLSFLLLLHLT